MKIRQLLFSRAEVERRYAIRKTLLIWVGFFVGIICWFRVSRRLFVVVAVVRWVGVHCVMFVVVAIMFVLVGVIRWVGVYCQFFVVAVVHWFGVGVIRWFGIHRQWFVVVAVLHWFGVGTCVGLVFTIDCLLLSPSIICSRRRCLLVCCLPLNVCWCSSSIVCCHRHHSLGWCKPSIVVDVVVKFQLFFLHLCIIKI